MTIHQRTVALGDDEVTFETGAVARQAGGAVLLTTGQTTLLAVVTASRTPRDDLSFLPLTTDYRHSLASVGKVPGGYERREAKATNPEVLTSRMIDRAIRPLFPDGWSYETQVVVSPLSTDDSSDIQVLAMNAVSAALAVSDLPWTATLAGVRIVRVDGQLTAHATAAQRAASDMDLFVAVSTDGLVMLEGGGQELPEAVLLEAFELAAQAAGPLHETLTALRGDVGPTPRPVPERVADSALEAAVGERLEGPLREALGIADKAARATAVREAIDAGLAALAPDDAGAARAAAGALHKALLRKAVLAGQRPDGRATDAVRSIACRAGWLQRPHGSSLFTRGETQAIVTCTLGSERDSQMVETMWGQTRDRVLLHYNFPAYSVGEVRPRRAPGRREIGHGALARRALLPVLPHEDWAYTLRLEATITESNGSSSMATICGASLAMLDAGVPLSRPVAGVAMGLVSGGDELVVLTDITGDEDHIGDMDFKVAGTAVGVTAIQLDNKLGAVPGDVMARALEQARVARLAILAAMDTELAGPREGLSAGVQRVDTMQIRPYRIRTLIGAGGSTINRVRGECDVEIDVADSGRVRISGPTEDALAAARVMIEDLTGMPEVGAEYPARVVTVKPFGSFVRLFEGVEGLLGGTELTIGETIPVRVEGVNAQGKLMISAVAAAPETETPAT